MKTFQIIIILSLMLAGIKSNAQNVSKNNDSETIQIKTSAQCEHCKENIEKAMAYEKGVSQAELDLKTKILTVKIKKQKTSVEKIRLAISKIGYDADEVAADKKAYEKLAPCCKKPE